MLRVWNIKERQESWDSSSVVEKAHGDFKESVKSTEKVKILFKH